MSVILQQKVEQGGLLISDKSNFIEVRCSNEKKGEKHLTAQIKVKGLQIDLFTQVVCLVGRTVYEEFVLLTTVLHAIKTVLLFKLKHVDIIARQQKTAKRKFSKRGMRLDMNKI